MPRLFTTGKQLVGVQTAEQAKEIVDEEAAAGYDGIKIYNDISLDALRALIAEAHAKGMLAVGHIPRNLRWQDMLAAKPDAIARTSAGSSPLNRSSAGSVTSSKMAGKKNPYTGRKSAHLRRSLRG